MQERNLTARQLAAKAGLSYSTVRGLMHGRHEPRRSTKERVARALDWPIGHLDGLATRGDLEAFSTTEIAHEFCRRLDD